MPSSIVRTLFSSTCSQEHHPTRKREIQPFNNITFPKESKTKQKPSKKTPTDSLSSRDLPRNPLPQIPHLPPLPALGRLQKRTRRASPARTCKTSPHRVAQQPSRDESIQSADPVRARRSPQEAGARPRMPGEAASQRLVGAGVGPDAEMGIREAA